MSLINQNLSVEFWLNQTWQFDFVTASSVDKQKRTSYNETDLGIFQGGGNNDADNISQEIRLHYNDDVKGNSAVIGLYVFYEKLSGEIDYITSQGSYQGGSKKTTGSYALFGHYNFNLNANWALKVGTRVDANRVYSINESILDSRSSPTERVVYDDLVALPSLDLTFYIDDMSSLNMTLNRGYRSGGSQIDRSSGQAYTFDPEYSDNIEVAYRSVWFKQRLRVNANMFLSNWYDQQYSLRLDENNPLTEVVQNIGESQSAGLELDINYQINDELSIYSSLGLLSTEILQVSSSNRGLGESAGDAFADAPQITWVLGGSYQIFPDFQIALDTKYTDDYFSNLPNQSSETIDSYFIINASANFDFHWGEAKVYINNLLNKSYVVSYNANENLASVGEVRVVGLMLTARY